MTGRPLVLIVDDEPFNVALLEQELEDLGCDTCSAADGAQALEAVARCAPDVVLLDLMMPVLDGFGVLARLKAEPGTRDLPVIVISAAHDLARVTRAIELGAEDHLPKPFEPSLLRARLEASLDRKRRRDRELEELRQVERLTAAAGAVEDGTFEADQLAGVAARGDALGRLADVFTRMALEVRAREARLRRQLARLERDLEERREAAADTVASYLPADRRHALARGEALPEEATGAVLLADVSGFTALGEQLARQHGPQRGAEELVSHLNRTLSALLGEVHRYGGSAVSFAGDAGTCWFAGEDGGERALACALGLGRAVADLALPGEARLEVKVAVAAGTVRRALVGDPEVRHFEVLLGEAPDLAACGERLARRGEVLAHEALVRAHAPDLTLDEWREADGARFAVVTAFSRDVPERPWPELPPGALPASLARPWLLPAVYERVCAGKGEFLAELRQGAALFLGFESPPGAENLDALVRWAQGVIARHGGSPLQLTVGGGAYLYAAFGVPASHEDDALRAVSAALDLQRPPAGLTRGVRIGVTYGPLRAGAYGGPQGRTYGAQGDAVNLAARLMGLSDGVLCDEAVYEATRAHLDFERLPPVAVRGRAGPVAVFRPHGATARATLEARLDALPPGAGLTLKVASVLGGSFPAELLRDVHPGGPGEAELAADLRALGGLLVPWEDGSVAFADPLTRDLSYGRLLYAQRRHLHRQAAEWYERHFATDLTPYLARLAEHWRGAEDPGRAAAYLEWAAEHAWRGGQPGEALAGLRASLALDAPGDS